MKQPENKNDAVESETLHILESLLDSIHKTQSFKGKWSLVETKLSNLKSQLSSLPPHSLSLSLLHSLSLTLSEALTLSLTCHSPNLPSGKLKTQNDVDSISAKLDNHIRDSNILIKSSLRHHHHHHHDVVSSVRNLVTRLQIGSVDSKTFALDLLLNLIKDEKNVVIVVAQGVVPVLVRLLDSGFSGEVREKTVTAIARVSSIESTKQVLLTEGFLLLHNLIRVLESGTGLAKEKACIVLEALTHSKENAIVICARGGISSLLQICYSGTPSSQAFAAGVLRNLTDFSHTIDDFIEGNGVSVLLTLASSGTALAQEHSIACLSNVVREDDDMKLLIVRKEGIDCLKSFWDSSYSTPAVRSLEVAVEFLSNLASDQRLVEVIISNGFLNRLISVLNCGVLGVRIHAAEAIYKMGYNAKTRKELGEFGFIPVLIRMLDGKAMEEIEAAAKALSTILIYTENRRIYRKEEKGIVNVVRLLDPLIKNVHKKYPISILMSLTHSTKCRKQMVSSGALLYLPKLVTMEVEDARKLEEMIGGGKLWGLFRRH